MCGGTAGDIIKGAQKEADKAIKGVQSAADSAINQATGNTSSSSGGKGVPVTTPAFKMPSYGGIGGGFKVPEINITSPINIPTPNLDQDLAKPLQPNLDQDLKAPVVEAVQAINVPRPNLDQDLTKVNAATVQEAVVDAGSAVQAQVIESGGAGQQALIDAASATQTNAIIAGDYLTGGQSNPALEQEASNITKGVEGSIATETKGLESSIQTEVKGYEVTVDKEVKGLEASLATEVKGIEQIPTDIANWNIDFAQKFDQSLDKDEDKYSSTTTPMANLDATEATGNEDPFADIETSTTKADKLTEEERLRRIRRLMLNRYGREDTILTGAKDPLNRRRYASAL